MELEQLEQEIMGCSLCKRLREVTPIPYPHVMYCKPEDVKLIIVARNPGLEDDYTDITKEEFKKIYHERWWNCRVGTYIRQRLGNLIIRNHTLFTNVIKCSSPKNSPITMPEKQRCLPYLLRQINLVNPKAIITMSNDAKQMLEIHTKNGRYNDIPVFNLYHPSYFIYNPKNSSHQDKLLEEIRKRL